LFAVCRENSLLSEVLRELKEKFIELLTNELFGSSRMEGWKTWCAAV
jgi:hypothetical protein